MAKKGRSVKRTAESQQVTLKQKPIDINFRIPEDMGLLYADQFTIQFYADEFVISFFQTEHPLVFSGKDFDERDTLDARCVARFVLNPNQMGRFAVAVGQNYRRWGELYIKDEQTPKDEDPK
jgi:hypothetical protein